MKIPNLHTYLEKYHVSLNFFSIFLLVTFIPDIIGIGTGIVTNGLWAVKGFLAILVILNYKEKIYTLKLEEKLFVFIVVIYFLNIFADVFLEYDLKGYGSVMDLISFVVSIIIAFSFRYNPLFASDKSFKFFVYSLALGLLIAFFMATPSPKPLIGRFDANSVVNTINYGQMSGTLCIISIYGYFNKKFKWSKAIFIAFFCLGILSIMRAGSRSPIVILALVGVFYAFSKLGVVKGALILLIVALTLWLSLEFFVEIGEYFDSGLAKRLVNTAEKQDTSGRDKIYTNVIGIIKDSPVLGSFYVIPSGIAQSSYPHNFFLEIFMATGLIGGIPFVIMTVFNIYKSFKYLKENHKASWLILLFLQLQIYGMFSSSLFSSQDYWALSLFMLSLEGSNYYLAKKDYLQKLKLKEYNSLLQKLNDKNY